jgi:hypothetical protein
MDQLDHRTGLETLKLLLQIAWADHQIEELEAQRILERARALGFIEVELETFESYLTGEAPLPPPDLGLLRLHREQTLETVREFLREGGVVCADERELIGEVVALLG